MKQLKLFVKLFVLALIGGTIYTCIEIAWRGYTHVSMGVLGAVCFVVLGSINEIIPWEMGLVWQALIGGTAVTGLEFITGIVVNIWLKLGVWDYSKLPLNIMGQVCLVYYILWILLSTIAIIFDDYLRYWFFDEEKPHYKVI